MTAEFKKTFIGVAGVVAASLLVSVFITACGQSAEKAPGPVAPVKPVPKSVVKQEPVASPVIQVSTNVQVPPVATGTVVSAVVSVSNEIAALRADIVDVAGRRGLIAGRLDEMKKNALAGDNADIRSINDEIRAKRDALIHKLGDLPEVVNAKKAMDEIEKKKKDLLGQRSVILERRGKPGATEENQAADAEQLKALEDNLRGLQKETQKALSDHRRAVELARERNPEIKGLSTEISEKEDAFARTVNGLPGIKEMITELSSLENRLRDLKLKVRLLEISRSTPQSTAAPTNAAAGAMPK